MAQSWSWPGVVAAFFMLVACAEGAPSVGSAPLVLQRPSSPTADSVYRPPGASRDLRIPVHPGLCHADDSTLLGQTVQRNFMRNMADEIISLQVSCNSGGVPTSAAIPPTYQISHVGLLPRRIPRVGLSDQAFANEVARESGDVVRTDVAAWDIELRRFLTDIPQGERRRFAVLPSTQEENIAVGVVRVNSQNVFLDLSTLLGVDGYLLGVESSYTNFDKTRLTVAQMVAQHQAWLRAIRFANRPGAQSTLNR